MEKLVKIDPIAAKKLKSTRSDYIGKWLVDAAYNKNEVAQMSREQLEQLAAALKVEEKLPQLEEAEAGKEDVSAQLEILKIQLEAEREKKRN